MAILILIDCQRISSTSFYSEIEAREKSITILAKEMKNQEELIKAADDLLEARGDAQENWNKYQKLKKKAQGD